MSGCWSAGLSGHTLCLISVIRPVFLLHVFLILFLGEGLSRMGEWVGVHMCVCLLEWGRREGRLMTQTGFCMDCVTKPNYRREAQCVYECVRGSVPAAEVRLQPRGLIHTSARNWGDWDPGTATGCQSSAAGEIHILHMYIFPPADLCPAQIEREPG